jgi:hypothetical protein
MFLCISYCRSGWRQDLRTIYATALRILKTPAAPRIRSSPLAVRRNGIATLAAIFLEIQRARHLLMIVCLVLHEATAIWDVNYAYRTRAITPIEQHVHSFLEMLPLAALLVVITLHWQQFLSLFGLGTEPADFALRLKKPPLPWLYVTVILLLVLMFEVLPYLEELVRCLRERRPRPSSNPR